MWLWSGSGLSLTLLIYMIIQNYGRIIMHCKYVHNALQMDALSKVLPIILVERASMKSTLAKKSSQISKKNCQLVLRQINERYFNI